MGKAGEVWQSLFGGLAIDRFQQAACLENNIPNNSINHFTPN